MFSGLRGKGGMAAKTRPDSFLSGSLLGSCRFYAFVSSAVRPSGPQSTLMTEPGSGSLEIIILAASVSTLDCIKRFNGRAPYTGS